MPKWAHDNPHAERRIAALELRGWMSQRQREQAAREAARRARAEAALRAVPWADLSPAELAFRWTLERDPDRFALWAAEARAAWARRALAAGCGAAECALCAALRRLAAAPATAGHTL